MCNYKFSKVSALRKRRRGKSLPLFSTGGINPLILNLYLSLQWAPLILTRNNTPGLSLRFGLLALMEGWKGWQESELKLLWFWELWGLPGLSATVLWEFGSGRSPRIQLSASPTFVRTQTWPRASQGGPGFCVSNLLPGSAAAAGPRPAPWITSNCVHLSS